jgi:hypothetical protein
MSALGRVTFPTAPPLPAAWRLWPPLLPKGSDSAGSVPASSGGVAFCHSPKPDCRLRLNRHHRMGHDILLRQQT